ncbi:MAG: HEAT repeat domain-containing protein [Methanomicrobiales archaeon]|nr:HEAT repeat domain-containing protein [Methanomicrobiales archaeon]
MKRNQNLSKYLSDLRSSDLQMRHAAEDALATLGKIVVESLVQFLQEEKESEPKWYAARALARVGEPAVGALLDLLHIDSRDEVRRYAAAALAEMKNPAIAEIISLLGEPDPKLRRYGMMILCRIGALAVEALKAASQDNDGMLGQCAQYTLLHIGIQPRQE